MGLRFEVAHTGSEQRHGRPVDGTFFHMVGRTRRHADAIATALGVEPVLETQQPTQDQIAVQRDRLPILDQVEVFGLSRQVDRELRKKRTGRHGWRVVDENSMAMVLERHDRTRIGARIAFLSHPNGRVRMTAVLQCASRVHQTGVLRTLVHRCTDRVAEVSAPAREIVGAALASELARSPKGSLMTPVAHAVAELRCSADLVLRCPELVIDALELTATSWQPRRRWPSAVAHQYDQLASHLRTTVTSEASEQARAQLIHWLLDQVRLNGGESP